METYLVDSEESYQDFIKELEVNHPLKFNKGVLHFDSFCLEPSDAYRKIFQEAVNACTFKSVPKDYRMVETEEDFKEMLDLVKSWEYVAYDTETTGLNVRKDKVIGIGVCGAVGVARYLPIHFWDGDNENLVEFDDNWDRAKELLTLLKTKKLIMHNASFDVRVTKNNLKVDLVDALHADTVMAKHTVEEEGDFGLKECAIQYQRELRLDDQDHANQEQLDLKTNVVSKGGSWVKSNKEMFKADTEILSKYCCADVDITLRLFYYLEDRLESEGLTDFFYQKEVMPLYKLVTIPMEDIGVHIDMDNLRRLDSEIVVDIKNLTDKITGMIVETDEGKEFLKDLYMEEYPPKPAGTFAQLVCRYYDLPLSKTKSGKYSITMKSLVGLDQENTGVKFLSMETQTLPDADLEGIYQLVSHDEPIFNINSKSQLGKFVFDYLNIDPLSKTKKGARQFNDATIEYLDDVHGIGWAFELRELNKLCKIKSSYFERFLTLSENGIYYPTFKQFATTSGRYGADLQQIPRPKDEDDVLSPLVMKYVNKLRELVISKPGYKFIDDDYDSLEPRCFADDASENSLIDIFIKGHDFYSGVVIEAEQVLDASADKKAPNYLKNLYPEKRQSGKAYALGIRYGMQPYKLSQSLKISEEAAKVIWDGYFKKFPNLKAKMEQYKNSAKKDGIVVSKFGRIRHLPEVKQVYEKFGDDIISWENTYKLAKKHKVDPEEIKKIRKSYNGLLNNALNFPIQAAATSIVNQAAIAMTRKFKQLGLDAWVSLQIHDQLVISCKEEHIEQCKPIVQDCMENTNKLSVPLIAKPEVASNLREGHI
jgi:DNA polymerase I-like protein with 3'-5' exonuclease and polymerase domains